MKKLVYIFIFSFFSIFGHSQDILIRGSVKDAVSLQPILNVTISLETTGVSVLTDVKGEFVFNLNVPLGEQILKFTKLGYTSKRFPIIVDKESAVDISGVTLERDELQHQDVFVVTLSDDELDDEVGGSDNISGLLSSSLDIFQRTAAFDFSQSFFKLRGLGSENSSVLINGISMNKHFSGRPQWSNWGGLNDVMRNQELTSGLSPSNYIFGGVLGVTNINVRASRFREGGRITYSSSNRSYTNRLMAMYASGLLKNNWAYTVSIGRRWGNEGYQDATIYKANSFFVSVEKQLNDKHSLNFTGIYAPNRRGKSSPNTQEVFDLKGTRYNEYWGWQDGKKRNSRIKDVEEPIFMINHYWNINLKTTLNTNIAYQTGKQGSSRLDNNGTDLVNGFPEGGGANPSPAYYQKLPSYFERNFPNDLQFAYLALQEFQDNGQIDWGFLYQANISRAQRGANAVYALYEDRVDDKQFSFNSILKTTLSNHIVLNAAINYQRLKSKNFAQVLDLLGAKRYLDIDQFAIDIDEAQNDLQNPNRLVTEGDTFKYNYNLFSNVLRAYVQAQFRSNKIDLYLSGSIAKSEYQRAGLFQNGAFPNNSLGKGEKLRFTGLGVKTGLTYKISGRHLLDVNGGYIIKAPSLKNVYSNARENHNVVPNITEEKITSIDASYIFRSPRVKAKLTGYYTKIADANEISFFFTNGIGRDNGVFVQEILQGIEKQHIGSELGIEIQATPTIKLKTVASIGQFTYANNPNLYLTTESDQKSIAAGFINGFKDFGASNLKHYKISAGPHRAYSIGFEYRDPEFWWFGATANIFTNTYIDISPLARSLNFTTDFDGKAFNDYDENLARELLSQERFDDYMVINLVGGKSWKIGKKYVSIFISINNVLDEVFKTGGFEQGRNANYRQLRDDKSLKTPVFGSKYWYGRGATYFLNINYKL